VMSYKVCYVTTLPITLKNFVLKSASYNIDAGDWEVTFICNKTPGFADELPTDIRYIPVTLKRGVSLSGFKSVVELYKIFKKEKFDLVQYSTSNAGCYASIAARFAGIKTRLYCQWGLDYIYYSGVKRVLFEIVERVICKNSTHVQPDSYGNLEISYREKLYDEKKGCVIGYGSASGVDLVRFDWTKRLEWREDIRSRYEIPENAYVFGYVGRLLGEKGLNELFIAMKEILEKRKDVFLMIVGDTGLTEGLKADLFEWAQNAGKILFTGFTSEVEKYYAAMDCFILPSYHEGFGSSTIEAEAMGVPVIVTDIPGPREAIEQNKTGLLVKKKDPESLKEAMEKLLNNPEMGKEFGKAGIQLVNEKFEQEALFEKIYLNRTNLLERNRLGKNG